MTEQQAIVWFDYSTFPQDAIIGRKRLENEPTHLYKLRQKTMKRHEKEFLKGVVIHDSRTQGQKVGSFPKRVKA